MMEEFACASAKPRRRESLGVSRGGQSAHPKWERNYFFFAGIDFAMARDLQITPEVLGRAVKQFCRTNLSFDILWSISSETRKCGWSDGGCWILGAAIQQRWGGDLYCLSRTGTDAQHVVVCFGKVFIDKDGHASATDLIRRFKRWECIPVQSPLLVPFSAKMGEKIPRPRKLNRIIDGICNHLR